MTEKGKKRRIMDSDNVIDELAEKLRANIKRDVTELMRITGTIPEFKFKMEIVDQNGK